MNNPFAEDDNVWGDPANPLPTSSVLFSANANNNSDNPYASSYGFGNDHNTFGEEEEDEQNGKDDQLQEVNFNDTNSISPLVNAFADPQVDTSTSHDHIFNELSSTMKSVAIDNHADPLVPSKTQEELEAAELERMKEKKKELLSSLTQGDDGDDDDDPLHLQSPNSLLSDTPNANENLFAARETDSGPLADVLTFAKDSATLSSSTNNKSPNIQSITSPNKKTRLLRPRRGTRGNRGFSPISIESQPSADPLSINDSSSQSDKSDTTGTRSTSGSARKHSILKTVNEPLFDLKTGSSNISSLNDIMKPTPATPPRKKEDFLETAQDQFDIAVGDPIKVGDLTSAHIEYTITTKTKSELLKNSIISVNRRYRDFLWLYQQLLNNHPGFIIPPPPEKQVYGRFDEKFVENRRIALEKMLIKISRNPILQRDYDFIIFLQSDNFTNDSKERENIHYHGDGGNSNDGQQADSMHSSTINDFSVSSIVNSTANANQGGFFSSIVGFTAPKYVESDNFILEKQVYIENLDQQLRSLSKCLDFILEKREEVIISLNELINIVQQLADLDVNSEITELLSNFEELQTKIKELLERTNMQQLLTLGSTVDEYIRIIGSIRNCFETRFKLCNSIATLESQFSKKQKNLSKFKLKNHNQTDKINKYENELTSMETSITKQNEFKDEFNKNFKKDLSKFEFEKIDEFKGMIEIYWEGLIESQKELIELWESFYDKCKFDDA